ncbi:ECF transporter S component [Clostridium ganghwense]|uniref:ECF transporter S component n=1 Tax=Clostridium ganghwense TaxID=312089 RepID=A0ABT4CJV0_9CLOT|nr:ECF transporter S component [Clostridium ganghwense]MCY6369321.1 ECF transporter S component [Clostridium ganghwense]
MKTKRVILIGLFAAICFIGTYIHIPINLGGSNSMIHLGTTAIFICAILIGKDAGLAGAIGCALFDATNPMFAAWIIPTFIVKGLTGYVAGSIAFAGNKDGNSIKQNILAFVVGGLVSLVGYFIFNWLVFVGYETAVLKMITSFTTTSIGVVISIPIAAAVKPIINKSGIKLEA